MYSPYPTAHLVELRDCWQSSPRGCSLPTQSRRNELRVNFLWVSQKTIRSARRVLQSVGSDLRAAGNDAREIVRLIRDAVGGDTY